MSREILFRGKVVETDKWVYGYFVNCEERYGSNGKRTPVIIDKDAYFDYPSEFDYECTFVIDPNTLGQFIGLVDKNGNKIFEGDIVDMNGHGCGFERYEKIHYYGGGFSPFACPGWECTPNPHDTEVVGNIWDNPEFLKEREE